MGYSVGIGLTNNCNLNCAHCYRETNRVDHISLEQVKQICEAVPVTSMGMGTGENALHPQFREIVDYLAQRGVRLSLASNGYSLTSIPERTLCSFHDVEVSIDFATQFEQDRWRGEGNWALVHRAIERCQALGVEVSILATLMRNNYDQMDRLVALARRNGTNLRVNAYQAVKSDLFRLEYAEFWEGYRRLFLAGLVVSCSEPVVKAVMMANLPEEPGVPQMGFSSGVQSPCGRGSIRFNPRGHIIPCVYWPVGWEEMPGRSTTPGIVELARYGEKVLDTPAFQAARYEPPRARDCPCRGGCASRRALNRRLDAHDDYCPWVRGESPRLDWQPAPAKDLMRSGNVCTTVVI
jgi:MoaA/NifB/PqqE/SkfB family radical SAM enzyme